MAATAEKLMVRVGADIKGFSRGMSNATDTAKKSAKVMIGAFVGVTTAAALIGSKFEKSLIETATVAQAFGKDLETLEAKARQLGKTTAFTATQAAEGMYALASAGLDTAQIVNSVDDAMKFAGATASTMQQSTGLLAASMKQFGYDADESRRITDTFAEAITSSQLTTERLSESMKYAGTTGASLGWSIEQTTAAVAQFVDLGLEGSQAGTNLRMAMLGLVKGTDQAQKALAQMDLTLEDVSPETHSFGEILLTLGENAMTSEESLKIFGARAALNMRQLSELAIRGGTDFDAFVTKLKEAQEGVGRTSEMYSRMMDTFEGDWKIMLSALQDLAITYFDTFKVKVREWMRSTKEVILDVTKYVRDHKEEIGLLFESISFVVVKVSNAIKIMMDTYVELSNIMKKETETNTEAFKRLSDEIDKTRKTIKKLDKIEIINAAHLVKVNKEIKLTKKELAGLVKEREKLKVIIQEGKDLKYEEYLIKNLTVAVEDWDGAFWNVVRSMGVVRDASDELSDKELANIEKLKKAEEDLDNWLRDMKDAQDLFFMRRNENLVENHKEMLKKLEKAWKDQNATAEDDARDSQYIMLSDFNLFIDGIEAGWGKATKAQIDWKESGEKLMTDFVSNTTTAFSDSFVAIIKGDWDSLGDAWEGFLDRLIGAFADMLADMVAKWVISGLGSIFSSITSGGGSSIGGGIVDIIKGWFGHGTGPGGVSETGIYGLHEGEIVLNREQSDMLRGTGSGEGGGPGGLTGHLPKGAPIRPYEDDFWRDTKTPEDFIEPKDFLIKGIVGALVDAVSEGFAYGIRRDTGIRGVWAEVGAKVGQVVLGVVGLVAGGPALGAMGSILGSGIGTVVGDLLGDMFNARETEPLRDFLEDRKGFFGGRKSFAKDFYDEIGTGADPLGAESYAASFRAIHGNFIEDNKRMFGDLGLNTEDELSLVDTEIESIANNMTTKFDNMGFNFGKATNKMIADISGMSLKDVETEFDTFLTNTGDTFGYMSADDISTKWGAFDLSVGKTFESMTTSTTDLKTFIDTEVKAATTTIDAAVTTANTATNAATAAAGKANVAAGRVEDAKEDWDDWDWGGDFGDNDSGGRDRDYGGVDSGEGTDRDQGDMGDMHSGGRLGHRRSSRRRRLGKRSLRSDEGLFLGQAGEEIVSTDNLELLAEIVAMAKSGSKAAGSNPMNVTVNVAGQEFETEVREWADDVRVEAIRRDLTTERLYNP